MYTVENFRTKKALKEAVATGKIVEVYQPGPFGDSAPKNGSVCIEGPSFEPHKWYASAIIKDGVIISIK